MKITRLPKKHDGIFAQFDRVNHSLYYNNLDLACYPISATGLNFTLRVKDSYGHGARYAWTGRHTIAACWHAHRDVLTAIFNAYPMITVRTALVVYRGRDDFLNSFEETYWTNAGSMMQPCIFGDLCLCTDEDGAQADTSRRGRRRQVNYGQPALRRSEPGPDAMRWNKEAEKEIEEWNKILRPEQEEGIELHFRGVPYPIRGVGEPITEIPTAGLHGGIEFSTLEYDAATGRTRTVNVRHISAEDLHRCPHFIWVAEHYREDGTCRCNEGFYDDEGEWHEYE